MRAASMLPLLRETLLAEGGDGVERRAGLVELRGVPAVCENEAFDRRFRACLDRAGLPNREILIVRAVDEERRRAPAFYAVLDGPGQHARVEPGVAPAEKGAVDMGMIIGEPAFKVAAIVSVLRLLERFAPVILAEDMRREENEAFDPPGV